MLVKGMTGKNRCPVVLTRVRLPVMAVTDRGTSDETAVQYVDSAKVLVIQNKTVRLRGQLIFKKTNW